MDEFLSVLNPEQRAAVEHEGSPLLILAGAGSGKTRVITTKIAYLISERNVDPYQILAVTFTKKAANEMQQRLPSTAGRVIRKSGHFTLLAPGFSVFLQRRLELTRILRSTMTTTW